MEVNSFFREKNIAEQKLLYRETFGLCPGETKTICQMLGEEKKKKTKKRAKSVKTNTFVWRSERLMQRPVPPVYTEQPFADRKRSNVSLSKISIGVGEDSMSKSDKFKCQLCPDTFAFKNSLKKHVSSYHQRKLYMCDLCTSTFLRKDSISRHKNMVHDINGNDFECSDCSSTFNYRPNLMRHIRMYH